MKSPLEQLRWLRSHLRTIRSPDRIVLVRELLPAFAAEGGMILWIGVRSYTRAYPGILERRGAACWTLDIEARRKRFGRKGRHVTADLLDLDRQFAPGTFTAVLCNGVFGWGVDGPEMQRRAFEAMARTLAPGGRLLLGWNPARTEDPLAGGAHRAWFAPAEMPGLPGRREIAGGLHVYDLLQRLRSAT